MSSAATTTTTTKRSGRLRNLISGSGRKGREKDSNDNDVAVDPSVPSIETTGSANGTKLKPTSVDRDIKQQQTTTSSKKNNQDITFVSPQSSKPSTASKVKEKSSSRHSDGVPNNGSDTIKSSATKNNELTKSVDDKATTLPPQQRGRSGPATTASSAATTAAGAGGGGNLIQRFRERSRSRSRTRAAAAGGRTVPDHAKELLVAVTSCRSDGYYSQKAPGSISKLPRKAPTNLKLFHELAVGVKDAYAAVGATPRNPTEEEKKKLPSHVIDSKLVLWDFIGNLDFVRFGAVPCDFCIGILLHAFLTISNPRRSIDSCWHWSMKFQWIP